MPASFFRCPDGVKRTTEQCFKQCPRPEGRCLSLPYLYEVGSTRVWKNVPSTTQLLNPTRTVVSQNTGILDLLEPDELKDGSYKLVDYKTWGSYALAKILGRSKNSGEYEVNQISLQLNNYRIKAEQLGFPVSRLLVQCTIRDGGTFTARNNKIDEKVMLVPVDLIDNDLVLDYFYQKTTALLTALETDTLPGLCPFEERWGRRRCKGFCDVAEFCPEGAKVNKVKLET